jgi:hypothetical protein
MHKFLFFPIGRSVRCDPVHQRPLGLKASTKNAPTSLRRQKLRGYVGQARLRPVVKTPDFALLLRLRDGYVWEAGNAAPGGEPLWHVPQRPPDVRLGALQNSKPSQQAAPGNDPNAWVVLLGVREMGQSNRPLGKTSRWVIPGSRLFNPMLWPSSRSKEVCEVLGQMLKRLPSRRCCVPGVRGNPGVHLTPPTMKPSASSAARTLATWSPWISIVRSFTVPPVLHADRSFFATFSMIEAGRWVAKS